MKKCIDIGVVLVTLCVEVGVTFARSIPMATWIAAVRHPQKQDDIDGIYRGDAAMLSEEGERQAEVLIERVRALDIDIVQSSDTPRTALVAARIGDALNVKVETNSLFREWRAPDYVIGKSKDDPSVKEMKRLTRDGFDSGLRFFEEESRPMLEARNRRIITHWLNYPRERILFVGHGKLICGLVTQTIWGSLEGYYRGPDRTLKLDHTGITIFSRERDRRDGLPRLVVTTVNDIAHRDRFYEEAKSILGAAE